MKITSKELKTILEKHKLWLTTDTLDGRANLSGASLCGADLRGADLRDAVLFRAALNGAALNGADLSGADLRDAVLDYTNLPMCRDGMNVHISDGIAKQQLYYLLQNVQYSKHTSAELKTALLTPEIIEIANDSRPVVVHDCEKITLKECGEK